MKLNLSFIFSIFLIFFVYQINASTICGDGKVTFPEQCDLGSSNGGAAQCCRKDCTIDRLNFNSQNVKSLFTVSCDLDFGLSVFFGKSFLQSSSFNFSSVKIVGTNCTGQQPPQYIPSLRVIALDRVSSPQLCWMDVSINTTCRTLYRNKIFIQRNTCCGDNVIDEGEQCDFGTLSPPARNGIECCDAQCKIKTAGSSCRPRDNSCPRSQQCSGTSALCPTC